ncbi:MAG: hypothetical protein AAF478_02440 [Pseudomonadota bacterium]
MPNTDNPETREVLSAKISAIAVAGWRDFCALHGITLTAMLEVAGRELADNLNEPIEPRRKMIEKAREVDRLRRRRK